MSIFLDLKDLFERRLLTAVTRDVEEQRTTREYEEELQRQRKLLDVTYIPEMKLHRTDVPLLMVKKEELPPEQQERSPNPDLEDNEFPLIKEEQEELWIGQRREQLQGLEEADTKFLFSVHMKSENDEEKPESSLLHQRLTDYMETAAGGEDCGRTQPARSAHPEENLQQENKVQTKASSDTGSGTEDDWKENRDSVKMLKSATNRDEIEKSHVVSLTEKRPFGCLECGKRFNRKGNRDRHMLIHKTENTYSCPEFSNFNEHLTTHMAVHTNEKPFCCSECGKRFSCKSKLGRHMFVHSEEKPFSCSECGKSFSYKSNLKRHMFVHSREKPFSCSECGKGFNNYGNLIKHTVVHSKEKHYICSECGKGFKRKKNLVAHVVIHSKVKPYSCSECGKGFNFKVCLTKHGCSLNRKTNAEK